MRAPVLVLVSALPRCHSHRETIVRCLAVFAVSAVLLFAELFVRVVSSLLMLTQTERGVQARLPVSVSFRHAASNLPRHCCVRARVSESQQKTRLTALVVVVAVFGVEAFVFA